MGSSSDVLDSNRTWFFFYFRKIARLDVADVAGRGAQPGQVKPNPSGRPELSLRRQAAQAERPQQPLELADRQRFEPDRALKHCSKRRKGLPDDGLATNRSHKSPAVCPHIKRQTPFVLPGSISPAPVPAWVDGPPARPCGWWARRFRSWCLPYSVLREQLELRRGRWRWAMVEFGWQTGYVPGTVPRDQSRTGHGPRPPEVISCNHMVATRVWSAKTAHVLACNHGSVRRASWNCNLWCWWLWWTSCARHRLVPVP